MRYTVKELKTMSVKELVKILVKSSMSTNKSSKQLEKAILNILSEREAAEYNRMMQSTEENEWDWIIVQWLFNKITWKQYNFLIWYILKGCDIIITISEKLEIVLKRLDISKKELADKLGTSQPNISKKFKYNDWRESDVKEICSVIGVECETIFKLEDGTIV